MFNENLKNVIDSIKCSTIPCYLLGDFNINLLNQSSHQATSDFLDILYSGGFIPLISRPTRITGDSATLIDHIYTNNYHVNTSMYQGVLVPDITDHYPVFHISHFHDNQANNIDKFFLVRKINEINMNAFRNTVINFQWSAVNDIPDSEDAFSLFYSNLVKCLINIFLSLK